MNALDNLTILEALTVEFRNRLISRFGDSYGDDPTGGITVAAAHLATSAYEQIEFASGDIKSIYAKLAAAGHGDFLQSIAEDPASPST